MADPWDVYVSFMKMNGVPLLPPVLTKERRSEMQYYQLLAKEVESRISRLTPYCIQTTGGSEQEKDTTSDSTVCDSPPDPPQQDVANSVEDLAAHIESALKTLVGERIETPSKEETLMIPSNDQSKSAKSKNDTKPIYNFTTMAEKEDKEEKELPEKDGSYSITNSKGVMAKGKKISFSTSLGNEVPKSAMDKKALDKSATMSKKRMSGSLIDLSHSPERRSHIPRLQRQNSYTLLAPSPQLLAHLEARTQQAAPPPATQLSSSDSQCSPKQKRRNWDLETAKVKWSDMAMELKQKHGVPKLITKSPKTERPISGPMEKDRLKSDRQSQTMVRSKSSPLRNKLGSLTSRTVMRSEVRVESATTSPTRRVSRPATPSPPNGKRKTPVSPTEPTIPPQYIIGENEDPSRKVRDLFETIQKQQVMQMASLVEKQKREQMMLQQVFEEQNMYLSRQIKNICPEMEIRNVSIDPPTRDLGGYDPYHGSLSGMEGPKGTVSTYVYHYDGLLPPRPPGAADYKSIKYPPFTRNIITQTRSHAKKQTAKSPKGRKGKGERSSKAESSDDVEFAAEPVRCPVDERGELLLPDECNLLRGTCLRPAGAKRPCSPGACDKHGSVSFTRGPPKPREEEPSERERAAATVIVAHARGFLTRRLLRTAKVRALVQTIRDALLCALQLHQDRDGVRGADVDLHRRLIQQITAACYAVHETVITNPIAQKMAIIAADRVRQRALAAKLSAAPLQRRHSPTATQLPARRQSPAAPALQQRASHTVSSVQRASPALQRRGSPPFPLATRQSPPRQVSPPSRQDSPPPPRQASPPPPLQRRPSPATVAPPVARPQQKRTGAGTYTVPPYSQPAPPAFKPTHDAGITARVGRGHSPQPKQRWL